MFRPEFINNKVLDILSKSKNKKTAELAKEWGIPRITLDSIKNSDSNPTIRSLYKIARGLGITINDMFDDEDWKTNKVSTADIVAEPPSVYNLNQNQLMAQLIKTQTELIECQKELYEIKTENEQFKKEVVKISNANVG